MSGPDTCGGICDFEVRSYPSEIRIRGQQRVKLIRPLLGGIPIMLNQQFRHGDSGRHRRMARLFQPCEDLIGEAHISRIRFHVVDEDAGVQSDPASSPEKGAETHQPQLLRSFSR
jgi:hypothetical protein